MENIMKEAQLFYNDLVYQQACDKNEDIRDRLSEVISWQDDFVHLLQKKSYFKFVVHRKSKEFWQEMLTKYHFSNDLIDEVIGKMN